MKREIFISILTGLLIFGIAHVAAAQEGGSEEVETPMVEETAAGATVTPLDEEAQVDEPNYPSAWFRVDTDLLSTQLWFGATFGITDNVGFATDIYLVGSFAELDLGLTFSSGIFSITPMAGIGFDFAAQQVTSLIAPQLFTIIAGEKLYFESWIQVFFNDAFTDGETDMLYTREFLLFNFTDMFGLGVQMEMEYDFNNPGGKDVPYLPVGLRTNFNYGKNNTLGLFLGYDIRSEDPSDGVAGRFTFVRTW